ncbi:YuzD family protein [Pseudogracilibacillus auburnensis]|uniref:Disulfide oxidoreductase YuzD n=1 Tax=Pseudogracilibacillus auburnensis TaxID=1494959 RepID=A0A2V3VIS0_9BACI|nr:YuzD family protein [Pseudogracilibacillus auburnensis]MBO1004999.1 YuzD family protein [Pseudogracilibacillus auburnensis]PXW81430.1 disulfide oxidoreductase YuzD [Pseudogracilibacillus auburnensis]
MSNNKLSITVYGKEQICASCVGAPGSWDTYEWLQAAIGRKFGSEKFTYEYIDIDETKHLNQHKQIIERIEAEDLFYPLVLLNGDVIAEGVPHLKDIYNAIKSHGV